MSGAREVIVLTHENPDPDAIASGWGVCTLVERTLGIGTRLLGGGVITRAENLTMVDTLRPPLELIERWAPPEGAAIVMVDTMSPPRLAELPLNEPLAAVIDHHGGERGGGRDLSFRFRDIRPNVIATSSMVAGYLRERRIDPSPRLATALTYGIYADAKGYGTRFSRLDRAALAWLSHFSDPELLNQIENATLPKTYYEDLVLALGRCFTYDDVAICFLPRATGPEVVGELADLIIRCDGVDRVLCAAVVGERMVFSARTTTQGGDATELLGATVEEEQGASWGGHEHRAGGYLSITFAGVGRSALETRLRHRWLTANGIESQRGLRLVARKEILKALD